MPDRPAPAWMQTAPVEDRSKVRVVPRLWLAGVVAGAVLVELLGSF